MLPLKVEWLLGSLDLWWATQFSPMITENYHKPSDFTWHEYIFFHLWNMSCGWSSVLHWQNLLENRDDIFLVFLKSWISLLMTLPPLSELIIPDAARSALALFFLVFTTSLARNIYGDPQINSEHLLSRSLSTLAHVSSTNGTVSTFGKSGMWMSLGTLLLTT